MKKLPFAYIVTILVFLILFTAFMSLKVGAVDISFSKMIEPNSLSIKYRMPRMIIAFLVGINMAIAGAILQSITKNPLASPDIVGVSSGSGLGAIIVLLVFPTMSGMITLFAFLGAIISVIIVISLSYQKGEIRPLRLVLTGVAVSSGFTAIITFLIVKYALNSSQALIWLKGSLYARSWQHIELLWPWTLAGLVIIILNYRYLNILQLSDESLIGIGMQVNRTRLLMLATSVGLAASAVSIAGTIGFVGLVVPPLSKLLVGNDSKYYLPVSGLIGALLVMIADLAGRVVHPPLEIPAGIITAILGAPYFVYLLIARK
ncbi:iron complex transport system permease protein [Cytobacillus firmus]|uniref:Iron complex transport system permease protein n=2 Tax=Cytobacillus TaxID=2675230 RepID=A0A366JGT2_CYTFI|nr:MULTISPECIES: iron ABC transporter permease [Cytobacillus]RBP86173.1 iron complex transport system permease protein [Cytobacillus firmus]TDX36414.1 iron complex transport system permease protein [Cytobacillus oceanisediminis]